METTIKHQFSDAEDSDGFDEDEPDDEEDDECDGDSTPKTLSRSTSPQSYAVNPKHFDPSCNPLKEQLGVSSPSIDDDLTFEQLSSSSEPCPPQLLSPCWDSPRQRYMSPRGDLSPQRHLLSSCDSSPLRAVSPKRDLSIRGDYSPIRQLSPVRPRGFGPNGATSTVSAGSTKRGAQGHVPTEGVLSAQDPHGSGKECEISSFSTSTSHRSANRHQNGML